MPASTSKYLDPKTIERIERLGIRARLVVEGFITGQHKSPYNGFAIEFAGHREYAPGDELKHIDWKVWSKTDRFYIKEYEEETNLKSTIIVDCSKSMAYGAPKWSKFDYAATAAAALAHLLQRQQDAAGLVTFNTDVEVNLPPSARANHLKQIIHELEETEPGEETDVAGVFLKLAGQVRRRGIVVLFSDLFVDTGRLREALRQMRVRGHEVLVFHIMHEDELEFPFEENTLFLGMESEAEVHADPRALRKSYLEIVGEYLREVRKICADSGVDYTLAHTGEPLDAVLARYLASRLKNSRKHLRR